MIRTFLHLHVKPGQRDALVSWYKSSGALEKAVEYAGCKSTELYADAEDENRLLVTALWETPEDYERWVTHPWRQTTTSEISEYLQEGFTTESRGSILHSIHHASLLN